MRAVISVVGKDQVGILAKVANKCLEFDVNIEDVSQTILQDMFTMIMIVKWTTSQEDFVAFSEHMQNYGKEYNLSIHVMHEDIFNAMHLI